MCAPTGKGMYIYGKCDTGSHTRMQGSFRHHNRKRLIGELLDTQAITGDHLLTAEVHENEEDKIRNLVIALHSCYLKALNNNNQKIKSEIKNIFNLGTSDNNINLYKEIEEITATRDPQNAYIPVWLSDQTKKLYFIDLATLTFMGIRVMALIDARSFQDVFDVVKVASRKIVDENDTRMYSNPDSMKNVVERFKSIEEKDRRHVFLRLILAIGNMFPKLMSFKNIMTENDLPSMLQGGIIRSNVIDAVNKLAEEPKLEARPRHPLNEKDEEYAIAVKGNAVNTSLSVVWSPDMKEGIDNYDQEQFAGILWKVIENYVAQFTKKYWEDGHLNRGSLDKQRSELGKSITMIRKELKDIWYGTFNWSVTPEVQGIEYEILYRLSRSEGNRNCAISKTATKEGDAIIRFMRHDKAIMPAFAAAVGKRLLTERIISRGRTSIVEHHRSVKWAETAFATLKQLDPIAAYKASQQQEGDGDRAENGMRRRRDGPYPMLIGAI